MYPIQCAGGFSLPTKAGKFQVCGVVVTAQSTTVATQIILVDDIAIGDRDIGYILSAEEVVDKKKVLVNLKGIANVDGTIGVIFPEPIKTIYGLSMYSENTVPGSVCVYIR